LCWFKPFSLHCYGNRRRSANMREPTLALREETRVILFAWRQLQTALSMPRIEPD
jgi:hypothetical protein